MLRLSAAGTLTTLVLLGGTACGGADEIIGDATTAAACTAARQAVAPVKAGARSAVQQLGVDPADARLELEILKKAVDAATATVSGEVRQSLRTISENLGILVDEARAAAREAVDQQAVARAQQELGAAVEDIGQIC